MAAAPQQWPVLGPEERKLLLAALNSNKASARASISSPPSKVPNHIASVNPAALDASLLDPSNDLDFQDSAFPDFSAADDSFDLGFDANESLNDYSDLSPTDGDADFGEKRKSPGDDEDHGDLKRRDSDEKQSKKPGRKPLTSEPTTKRKAQNRAAQRAFRERKEKHLKDLEQKVIDLEKASESANHENGLLRAQVERLADELKAYRRRISSGAASSGGPSPPRAVNAPSSTFDFDFPRFGGLPEAYFPGAKNSSNSNSPLSTTSSRQPTASSASVQQTNDIPNIANGIFNDGFLDTIDNRALGSVGISGTTTTSPDPLFDFATAGNTFTSSSTSQSRSMSQSTNSKATSPSVSSMSHKDPSSSCGTSPESYSQSPNMQKDKIQNTQSVYRNGFIEENAIPAADPAADFNFDWLANQNGGQFDPVLFGDYRDSQAAVVGDGGFSGGFFDDSMPFPDFNDSFNFNPVTPNTAPAPAPAKPSLMDQVAASREGDDEEDAKKLHERCSKVQPVSNDDKAMMTAHKIWNQLQNCPKFVSGDFDIDSLCTELSAKATCTESGVAVPKQAVEDALWRLVGEGGSNERSDLAQALHQNTQ